MQAVPNSEGEIMADLGNYARCGRSRKDLAQGLQL